MDTKTFGTLCDIVYAESGITLTDKKEALVIARVGKRMRALGMAEAKEYLDFLKEDKTGQEMVSFLDAISTNVTHFFRENNHFEFMSQQLGAWYASGQRKFRIWSAGCSTGEEPYTMAMTYNEAIKSSDTDVKILATDLSTVVLGKSKEGIYEERKMEQVSDEMRKRYFAKIAPDKGGGVRYQVTDALRHMITFSRLNLVQHPYPMSGPFDIIFCRNVMIYFDNETRQLLINEYHRLLRPAGLLFVGHAESLTGLTGSGFKTVQPSVYLKV